MTDIPTITQEEAVEVRARLCALLLDRDGADFDGEVHLTSAEGQEVIAALSPNMDHAVGGVRPLDTAPKDGSYFLMVGTNFDGGMAVVHWDDWWYLDDGKNYEIALRNESRLTGWLPLPSTKATTPPVNQDAVREGARAALRTKVEGIIRDRQRGLPSPHALVDRIMLTIPALATPPLDNTGLDAATVEPVRSTVLEAAEALTREDWQIATTCGDMIDRLPCARCGAKSIKLCRSGLSIDKIDAARDFVNGYGWAAARKRALASGDRS